MKLGETFARNLRLLRQQRALSQEKLARKAGINRNYVGMLEREENSPTIETIEALALALEIDADRLLHDKTPLNGCTDPDMSHRGAPVAVEPETQSH
jgi:transcriptional regulator with XRE-family HTH domain